MIIVNDLSGINDYELLGLSQDATIEEIVKRHKELTKTYHPDNNPGSNGLMQQLINNAKDRILYNLEHPNGNVQEEQPQQPEQPEQPSYSEPQPSGFDHKGLLDDYIEFVYGMYGDAHEVSRYVNSYINGLINSITRKSRHPGQMGYRELFEKYMSPQIVAQIVGNDVEGYISSVVNKQMPYQDVIDNYIITAFNYYHSMGTIGIALESYIDGYPNTLVPTGDNQQLISIANYIYANCSPEEVANITGSDVRAYVTNRIMTLNQGDRTILEEFERTYEAVGKNHLAYAIDFVTANFQSPNCYQYFTKDGAAIRSIPPATFIRFVNRLLDVNYTLINETIGAKAAGVIESIVKNNEEKHARSR